MYLVFLVETKTKEPRSSHVVDDTSYLDYFGLPWIAMEFLNYMWVTHGLNMDYTWVTLIALDYIGLH